MNQNKYFSFVPNTITSFNVLSGCLSVVFAFEGLLIWAGLFIFMAAVFDFFDGMSARLLHAYSAMGKELDSLADVISFGLAPASIAHVMVRNAVIPQLALNEASFVQLLIIFSPFILNVFSALRLAKFNIDTRQTESFIGLATPANAMVWASLPFVSKSYPNSSVAYIIENPFFIIILSAVMSFLLVSELPMFSLKFKNLTWSSNKIQWVFMSGNFVLLVVFQLAAIPLIIIWYILLSIIANLLFKKH